jgi:ubiquinone biosynthesis protein
LHVRQAEGAIDQRELESDLLDLLDFHFAVPIQDMKIAQVIIAIADLLRTHRLRLPADLVIMIRALVAAEGTVRRIYPGLDVVSKARVQITKFATRRYTHESVQACFDSMIGFATSWTRK